MFTDMLSIIVSFLVFEEEFFGDFGESLTVHQDKAVSLDMNGRPHGGDFDVQGGVQGSGGSHIEIDRSFE